MSKQQVKALEPQVREVDEGEPTAPPQVREGSNPRGNLPEWLKPFPPGFRIPKGKRLLCMRFRKEWTDRPDLGERQCVCWQITVGEERICDKRADSLGSGAINERAKISIRLIDAGENEPTLVAVNPDKSDPQADADIFWEQIGLKCRAIIADNFLRTHSLSQEERADFFEHCIKVLEAV